MVKLQILKDCKIVISDNTLKVFKDNNNFTVEMQAKNIAIAEYDSFVDILSNLPVEKKTIELKKPVKVYKVRLVHVLGDRLRAIKAVREILNLCLADAKDYCRIEESNKTESVVVCTTTNKEEALKTWSKFEEELKDTNVKVDFNEYTSEQ